MPSSRLLRTSLFAALVAAGALLRPSAAEAYSPFLVVPEPAEVEATPAYRYANMTDAEAFAELDRRSVLYTKLGAVSGVRAPIRLTGRLHGVYVHSSLPPDERVTSNFEILDVRLALALDDFAAILERHDIDEVVHFTMYRPNVAGPEHGVAEEIGDTGSLHRKGSIARVAPRRPTSRGQPRPAPAAPQGFLVAAPPRLDAKLATPKSVPPAPAGVKQKAPPDAVKATETVSVSMGPQAAPAGAVQKGRANVRPAPRGRTLAHAPVAKPLAVAPAAPPPVSRATWAPPGTRHPAGLAIDVGLLHKKDGRWLSVANNFHGHIGERTCGEGARVPEEPEARELRALVCEAGDLGVFTYVLTPDYNAAHVDHFHMEVKPGVHWFLYH